MPDQEFSSYIKKIKDRKVDSHVYQKHQQVGLDLAEILDDLGHKALYKRLAKTHDPNELLRIARDISQREKVKNKGAYFMIVVKKELVKNKT